MAETPTPPRIVAADHPSLDRDVDRFLDGLRREPRFFGPSARANPKPFPSQIRSLGDRDGFRLAAVEGTTVIGLIRVDEAGEVWIAVDAAWRGRGVGTTLGEAALARAIELGYGRLVLRSTRRSGAARGVGEALGCTVVEVARGRTDLIVDLASRRDIA
jgi:GNAT superfamily N-acetyltransferase